MSDISTTPQDWFMYHGGYGHGGNASQGSPLTSETVNDQQFGLLHQVQVNGSILSVPAVVDGSIYVGLANSHDAPGSNGGALQKYDIATGTLQHEFVWPIDVNDRDSHGFTGMGCTPTVINGMVYFIGFNAKLYCLNQSDLSLVWVTDLRYADPAHNQPVTNIQWMDQGYPPAAGWSSPTVVNMQINGVTTPRIFVGVGEGENPALFSFIYCLDATNGNVVWIYCTCQYTENQANPVNQLPAEVITGNTQLPAMYTLFTGTEVTRGCSVWSAIAYDESTGMLYAATGQPASPTNQNFDKGLPSTGWSSGILALEALTGNFVGFAQMPSETSYRRTDLDVDIGSACTLYELPGTSSAAPQKVVAVGCKNGGFMVCDAQTLEVLNSVSLLPKYKNGTQVEAVDPHPPDELQNAINPRISNEVSNANLGENYFGPFNTAAVDPQSGTLFVGIGGPNYHNAAPGIDSESTPFMKAVKWDTLEDAWPIDESFDPVRYQNVGASMYSFPGESGLSSPAVTNDVVFVSTSKVAIYAFKTSDGTLLWSDAIGNQTLGFNGGYGYCLGPAIYGKYVVAGALIQGLQGGVLNIYGLLGS
jgi:outer membrane protein assembly factor BamB